MGTPNNELLVQLRGAISSWTAEVGTAQRGLSQQIDGANTQLTRLLAVLHERQQLTTALARSNEELDRLKQTVQQGQLPAGAVTRYTVSPTPAADAATRELDSTISRLQTAVQSWTSQVAHSQGGLLEQFAAANRQLTQLLEILTEPAGPAPAPSAPSVENTALLRELEQLRHENRILSSEVHALNIEMETVRREQESFATANLASETERVVKHRRDMERLEKALATREDELKERQQAFEALGHEADGLRKEAARLQISEDRLQLAGEQQRHETAEHVSALSALSREMEALRRAFLGEDVQLATQDSDVPEDDENPEGAEALDRAEARIAVLESQLTDREIGREEVAVLEERIEALKEQLAVLEQRPTAEAFLSVEAHAALLAELEALRSTPSASTESLISNESGAPAAERVSELELRIAELESELAILSSRPTAEELASTTERAAELESRIVELESELAVLSSRPTAEELAETTERAAELESRIAELESELAVLTLRPTAEELAETTERAAELESRIAELESELAVLSSRPTAEELASTTERAAELESELAVLSSRPTAEELAETTERAAELESRIAELESELAGLALRPTVEDLAATTERAAELASRIAELESELAVLSLRPTAEEFAAHRERADTLELALEQLRADSNAATEMAAEATALRDQLIMMQTLLEELDGRPEAGVLEDARDRIVALEEEAHALKGRLATAQDSQVALLADERAGLQRALAAMESELAAMKRREEETMSTARTLLEEMETHRTYEAAQTTALSQIRNEAARLQDALTERQQQVALLTNALASAEAAREALALSAAEAGDNAQLEVLEAAVARLEEENAALATAAAATTDLQDRVDAQAIELEAATRALAAMQQDLDALQSAYAELREQSAAERAELEATARERDSRIAVLEADLPGHAESLMKASALEEALRAACARVEELETLALEAEAAEIEPDPELTAALAAQEAEVQRLTGELKELHDAGQTAAKQIEELERQLERAASEHAELQTLHAELNGRLDQLIAERESLVASEARQREAVEAALKEAEAALSAALEQEQALAAAMAALDEENALVAALESEKASLGEESQDRHREIREAMAQMSQVLHERDELAEELEAEKTRRERIFAGSAGAGKTAAEALELKEERARQQEILLSELTQPGQSRSMGDILVAAGVLSREQLSDALDEQQKDPTQLLGTILIERDYTTDDAIAQAVACQLEKPVVNPMEVHIHKDALASLSRDLCTWHVCIPLRITPDRLVVAMANPLDESAILKLRDVSQREITPVVATPSHIMGAIDNCYGTF